MHMRIKAMALMAGAALLAMSVPLEAKPQAQRASAKTSINKGSHNKSAGNRPATANRAQPQRANQHNRNNKANYNKGRNNVVAGNTVVVGNPRPGYPPPRYGGGGYYVDNDWDDDDDDFLEFVGKTAAVTAGAAIVGSILTDEPSNKDGSDCQQTVSNGQVYVNCNGTWYQPVQAGSNTNYQVVNPPV